VKCERPEECVFLLTFIVSLCINSFCSSNNSSDNNLFICGSAVQENTLLFFSSFLFLSSIFADNGVDKLRNDDKLRVVFGFGIVAKLCRVVIFLLFFLYRKSFCNFIFF